MTKLEEKLVELGYEKSFPFRTFAKYLKDKCCVIYITLNCETHEIINSYIHNITYVITQQDIDNLQQAFNQLQKDLEVFKEYERLD